MSTPSSAPLACPFEVPFRPDSIDSPTVLYGEGPVVILYPAAEGQQWVRVTFEGFDSLRVCRGEYMPYEERPGEYSAVYLVENSAWLRERYAYEAEHYRGSYEFGGDVDEMLTDFQHYLFTFHDQYVEVLARGVWFEASPQRFVLGESPQAHPLAALPESRTTERFTVEGLTCQVRTDPRPLEELVKGRGTARSRCSTSRSSWRIGTRSPSVWSSGSGEESSGASAAATSATPRLLCQGLPPWSRRASG